MSANTNILEQPLVPGRECGSCNVCCVALTIDDPEMQKPQGYRCRNTLPDKGCAIYETRPGTCRAYFCGWRRLKWVREGLRPDLSGVLVRMQYEGTPGDPASRLGVVFSLLTNASLKAEGLAETVAAAISAKVPVWVHVPGPPGYTAATARINDALQEVVLTRDKAGLLKLLRQIRAKGKHGKFVPIAMKNVGNDGTAV